MYGRLSHVIGCTAAYAFRYAYKSSSATLVSKLDILVDVSTLFQGYVFAVMVKHNVTTHAVFVHAAFAAAVALVTVTRHQLRIPTQGFDPLVPKRISLPIRKVGVISAFDDVKKVRLGRAHMTGSNRGMACRG